eukprot:symbB.v1.2.032692.t1/scaffold3956.1/size49429/5
MGLKVQDSLRLLDTGMTAIIPVAASAAMVGCEGARWTKAIEILNKVQKPNAVVFGSAMSACQRSQQRHAVAELLKDFVHRSLEQTQVMSSVAIAISTWRKALRFGKLQHSYDQMHKLSVAMDPSFGDCVGAEGLGNWKPVGSAACGSCSLEPLGA